MGGNIHLEDPPWGKMLHHAQSGSESKRAQNVEPIGNGNRGKRGLDPPGGRKAGRRKGRPSHNGRAGLRDDLLQHFTKNTRNTHVRCNKSKQLSTTKGSKFEHKFSDPVSSILNAENLRTGVERRDKKSTCAINFKGDTIISTSGHKVLTLGSCFEYESS